jgi:hypothetical protein
MSNVIESSTEDVKFRHQALVAKKTMKAFLEECKQRRWEPSNLLRVVLEERYEDRND